MSTMGGVTLTDFLLARIAEDAAVAHAAIGEYRAAEWHLGEFDETVLWYSPSSPEKIAAVRERFGDDLAEEHARWSGQTIENGGDQIAPHIARHDPARVLAECEAKRRIIYWLSDPFTVSDVSYFENKVLSVMAAVYADHPDYRDEWKP